MSEESTKQRALRIALEHHSFHTTATRWKWRLSFLAIVLTTGYIGWILAPLPGNATAFSPNSLSQAHSAWNAECSVCHEPFLPLTADAWQANKPEFLATVAKKCMVCHPAATHNALIAEKSSVKEASCTSCHVEHRGEHASLVQMTDHHCTHCHAQLQQMFPPETKLKFKADISSFASAETVMANSATWPHPAFRSLQSDPGNIKFNHALHMQAGLPKQPSGSPLLKYSDLPASYLQKSVPQWKPGENDTSPVQLECASCHEANVSTAISGEFMQPIKFEQHCQTCHSLNLSTQQNSTVPHGLPPSDLQRYVLGWLTQDANLTNSLSESMQTRLADKLIGKNAADLLAKTPELAERLEQAYALLHERCSKCHTFENQGNAAFASVIPSHIPTRWLQHGRFSHAAHKTTACVECHVGTDGKTTTSPHNITWDEDLVMIRNYDSCVKCHNANAVFSPSDNTLPARSDCVECHTYHLPTHGTGVNSP